MSLDNLAIGLMLRTFKGLKEVSIKDSDGVNLGNSNTLWDLPLSNQIKTLPFTVLLSVPNGITKRIDKLEVFGITPNASVYTNEIGKTTSDNLNFYSNLIDAYEEGLPSDTSIVHGTKFGNRVFDFILYRANMSAPLDGITHQNLTGTYNGNNDDLIESLYIFVEGKIGVIDQLTTMFSIRVNISSGEGGGSQYFFVVPMKTMYNASHGGTKLTYKLSDYGYTDNISDNTLIKFPNGIQERLNEL